jgi:hypothetical protein
MKWNFALWLFMALSFIGQTSCSDDPEDLVAGDWQRPIYGKLAFLQFQPLNNVPDSGDVWYKPPDAGAFNHLGIYKIDGSVITLVSLSCPSPGVYKITFEEQEVKFAAQPDNCLNRKEVINGTWERIP